MISIKRPALALGAAALMTVSLAACGGSDASGAPKDASKADFCDAWNSGDDAFEGIGDDDYSGAADAMHKMADKLKDVGTPSDIPSDAREGFEVLVKAADNASASKMESAVKDMKDAMANGDTSSDGPSEEEMTAKMFGVSTDDVAKVDAFEKWADGAC